MIAPYIYAFLSVALVSLISLVGLFSISVRAEVLKKYVFVFISLAIGALLGDSFIHLIPEALNSSIGSTLASTLIIFGVMIFFVLEKFLHWHHHGEDQEEDAAHPVGQLVLVSDGIHNFIDGIILGTSFLISIPVGIATTIAVILHEIPQEIGDFGVLLHAGYQKTRALWLNFLSALCAVLGVIMAFLFGESSETFALWILPVAAGGFIYVAVADLIPELHKNRDSNSFVQILAVIAGVLSMIGLLYLE